MAKFEMDRETKSALFADLTLEWFTKKCARTGDVSGRKAAEEVREFLDALCEEGETQPAGEHK